MTPLSPRTVGFLLLVLTACAWGSTWPVLKLIFAELPPFSARALTAYLAAALLFSVAALRGEALSPSRAAWALLPQAAFLNITAWMGFTTLALLFLTAAETAIIGATMPFWATLLGAVLLKEHLGLMRVLAVLLGFGGVVVLFAGETGALHSGQIPGALFMSAAAVLFAFGAVQAKRRPLPMPPVTAIAWQMVLGCAPLALLALTLEEASLGAVSTQGWLAIAWMVAFPIGTAYLAWFAALKRLPAGAAALGTLLSPVVGVAAAAMMLGEPVGWREGAALLMIGAGILISMNAPERRA
ncbi:MAG: DMT family transporter [Rubritepida sp.]|jgi:drug/metabolite transporter (DMT)-like permease|nr:DMT family transporter [Rubritepida sp.]